MNIIATLMAGTRYPHAETSEPKSNRFWTLIKGEGFRCSHCLVYSELGMKRRGLEVSLCLISCYDLPWVRRVTVFRALEDKASLKKRRK